MFSICFSLQPPIGCIFLSPAGFCTSVSVDIDPCVCEERRKGGRGGTLVWLRAKILLVEIITLIVFLNIY